MEQSLFTITCTTCQVQLTVRDKSLIGKIVSCPKCQSMVQIVPPEGWSDSEETTSPEQPPSETSAAEPQTAPPVSAPVPPPVHDTPEADTIQPPEAPSSSAVQSPEPEPTPPPSQPRTETPRASTEPRWTRAAAVVPPPLPKEQPIDQSVSLGETPVDMMTGLSPTEQLWRKGLLWIGVPAVVVLVVVMVWFGLSSSRAPRNTQASTPVTTQRTSGTTSGDQSPVEQPETPELPPADLLSAAWVPDDARLVVSVAPLHLADRSGMDRLLNVARPLWDPVVGRAIKAFRLPLNEVRRVTWSTGELGDLTKSGLIVIEVDEKCDLSRLTEASVPDQLRFLGRQCRRLTEIAWEEPFVVVGPHTIVTGQPDELTALGARTEPKLTSQALAEMLDVVPCDAELTMMVDLDAARRAGWRMPEWIMNVWPAGARPWQTLCRVPSGLGIDLKIDDHTMHSTIDLTTADESNAKAVLDAVERLTPLTKASLEDKVKLLAAAADRNGADDAYSMLLNEAVGALEQTRWEQLNTTIRLTTNWGQDLSGVGLLVLDGLDAIEADWKAAIQKLIQSQQARLVDGLDDYSRDKGSFPAPAVGGALLPPETRLSWIATLLPYYGHRDWHTQLEFGYPWNGSENSPVTRRVLPEVANPAFGPGSSQDGFPVTNYVGSAGLGEDAGRVNVNDPRAGLFGFGRMTQPDQIRDGARNTIAVFGVYDELGPWAAGGRATARPLTRQPYVNGPDGFGTGQPNGMYVGMADGSVRFLSKDIDPRVMESMVTINGGETPVVVDNEKQPPKTENNDNKPTEVATDETVVEPEAEVSEPDKDTAQEVPSKLAVQLARPIENVKYNEVELGDLVREMRELTGLDIRFDQKALAKAKISLDTPVSIELNKTTVAQVLGESLSQCGLIYEVRDGVIMVTVGEATDTP